MLLLSVEEVVAHEQGSDLEEDDEEAQVSNKKTKVKASLGENSEDEHYDEGVQISDKEVQVSKKKTKVKDVDTAEEDDASRVFDLNEIKPSNNEPKSSKDNKIQRSQGIPVGFPNF